ncbi:MAG: N-acetyltransferase [Altererythrobacter sp.]|nr:N-acetyltransferase [Altererythrobacter sp.]NNE48872.1 N-acetyltransferase [Altererythrobacter sp.]NNF94386.1 N-acetyltransferase [Altererythrobacter sp.]NNK46306.1 N-acetyltransferase [Altererythrobacter sp.]
MSITYRPEEPDDRRPIFKLTEAAFKDMPFSDGDERELVDRLRKDGDLTLSLVAETSEGIIGHIAFSPVTISDGTKKWYGLGPVSVWPELQGKGIGGALINRGITQMRGIGAKGIVLLGSPKYYSRFGFKSDPLIAYPGPPPEYFQYLILAGEKPVGTVSYAPGFE